jgi:hypothetical protein
MSPRVDFFGVRRAGSTLMSQGRLESKTRRTSQPCTASNFQQLFHQSPIISHAQKGGDIHVSNSPQFSASQLALRRSPHSDLDASRKDEAGEPCPLRPLGEGLANLPHVELHTPRGEGLSAGMTCFEIKGPKPEKAVKRLLERKIVAQTTPVAFLMRACMQHLSYAGRGGEDASRDTPAGVA